jgi:hypothetical protein
MKDPRYMYCPSEVRSYHIYEGEDNRWTPENVKSPPNLNGLLRAGFVLRPCDATYRPVSWPVSAPFVPPQDDQNAPVTKWAPYPRISKMKRVAIAADIFSTPSRITQRHETGINVVYSDSSANWVERKALTNDLPQRIRLYGVTTIFTNIDVNGTHKFEAFPDSFVAQKRGNEMMQAIWEMLDRRGR